MALKTNFIHNSNQIYFPLGGMEDPPWITMEGFVLEQGGFCIGESCN